MDLESIISRNQRASWKNLITSEFVPGAVVGRALKADLRSAEKTELLRVLDDVLNEWKEAVTQFNYVYEEKLVDYYTYKIKACSEDWKM
jgi:hypothetical protein